MVHVHLAWAVEGLGRSSNAREGTSTATHVCGNRACARWLVPRGHSPDRFGWHRADTHPSEAWLEVAPGPGVWKTRRSPASAESLLLDTAKAKALAARTFGTGRTETRAALTLRQITHGSK